MLNATEALARLVEGNERFVANRPAERSTARPHAEQRPFAIVLGCSDSRVPAEIVFDQGIGDLFVVRVAGNVAAATQIGSIEFAAANFGTRLVVVLGHSRCGAVTATLDAVKSGRADSPGSLAAIVDRVRPTLEPLLASARDTAPEQLLGEAVRANVRAAADRLREGSSLLRDLIRDDGLAVVGAEYSLDSGVVDFFDR